jgi:assimilatory nitrate reductase catalytic subunit
MKLVVIDPRRTDTAEAADLHLALLPGTDIALYNAMLHVMLWEGWVDRTTSRPTPRASTPSRRSSANTPGHGRHDLRPRPQGHRAGGADLRHLAGNDVDVLPGAQPVQLRHPQQLGADQPAPGHRPDRPPGAGPFSLTGQPNAMGGREVGGLANLLSAHRDMANPAHRAEVAALWGVDVPAKPGKSAVELFGRSSPARSRRCGSPAPTRPSRCRTRP